MGRRKNGEGSITYDEKRKKYFCSATDPSGKRVAKRFDTEVEADLWLKEKKIEMLTNVFVPNNKITVGEWFIQWLTVFKTNLRTKSKMQYIQTSKYLERIANKQLQKVTMVDVQVLLNTLPPIASSSKRKVYQLLFSMFKKAVQVRLVNHNIMINIEPPKVEQPREKTVFTQDELDKIILYTKNNEHNRTTVFKMYQLILLAINSGARIGEILGLRWKHINPRNNTITIETNLQFIPSKGMVDFPPKTKSGYRKIALPPHVIEAIMELKVEPHNQPDDFILHTKNGTSFHYRNIAKYWKQILAGANVPYKSIHTLRHTNATMLLASGVPILEVARRLGHAKTSHTLDLYGHAIPNYDAAIVDKIKNIFPK